MVPHKTPEWNHLHNTVIIHRYAIELLHSLFKTFLHRLATKEAAEGWERDGGREWERHRPVSYSGPAPASTPQQRGNPRSAVIPRPLGIHLSGAPSLYFTVTGDILVSRCHDEMAPLPRRSPRRRNQWNNEVPRSWGWNSGGPSWAQCPNPSPSLAPMKSGISRSVADDKSVSVCPWLFPGPSEDPGWEETQTQTQQPRDGSFVGQWGQPVCTVRTSDPRKDQTPAHSWHCGKSKPCLSRMRLTWVSRGDSRLTAMLSLQSI